MGFDVLLIREIRRARKCSDIPGAPDYFRGIVNIRGRVTTIMDLKKRLGWSTDRSSAVDSAKEYFLVLKTKRDLAERFSDEVHTRCPWEDQVGVVVDRLGEVHHFEADRIQPAPANLDGISSRYALGVIETDRQLLVILNMPALLGFGE